jgi:hypothetical protein
MNEVALVVPVKTTLAAIEFSSRVLTYASLLDFSPISHPNPEDIATMKLLCCHGYGMSSEIFSEMCQSLTAGIGSQHEYVFVDGEVVVNRSGG